MKIAHLAGALALAATLMPSMARADDPLDPALRSPAAHAHDRAIIRRLNQQQLAHVQQRDAGYAQGWQAYHEADGERGVYRAGAEYDGARADYERRMADWRRAVAACQAGDWSFCER